MCIYRKDRHIVELVLPVKTLLAEEEEEAWYQFDQRGDIVDGKSGTYRLKLKVGHGKSYGAAFGVTPDTKTGDTPMKVDPYEHLSHSMEETVQAFIRPDPDPEEVSNM